jgi:hypothetical protein
VIIPTRRTGNNENEAKRAENRFQIGEATIDDIEHAIIYTLIKHKEDKEPMRTTTSRKSDINYIPTEYT